MTNMIGRQAVVIGAGIGGLCAARALSAAFEQVIVLERDGPPDAAAPRAGAPQGHHPHMLMAGGLRAMTDLAPDLPAALERAGARRVRVGRDVVIETPDWGAIPPRDLDFLSYAASRPVLEAVIYGEMPRGRRIEIRHHARVTDILVAEDRARVIGVTCEDAAGSVVSIPASLVVDASAGGVLLERCLETCGLPPPPTLSIGVDVGYATGVFRLPPDLDFETLVTYPRPPQTLRNGMMMRLGASEWQVLMAGRGPHRPPSDLPGFLAFAQTLNTPSISDLLRRATPPDSLARYRFPASTWRRFGPEALPQGLLPLGDSVCRFNPVYAQGMTVAAMEAALLAHTLRRHAGAPDAVARVGRDYLAGVNQLVGEAWTLSTSADFTFPTTTGRPPANLTAVLAAQHAALEGAVRSERAHRAFLERLTLMTFDWRTAGEAAAAPPASEPEAVR